MTKTTKFYEHWSSVPLTCWRWMDFIPEEISCKSDGSLILDTDAMDRLQHVRDIMDKPLIINSAYRTEQYNKSVGGSPRSMHLKGKAFDISTVSSRGKKRLDRKELYKAALKAGFTGFGFYDTFLHVDTGRKRSWINGAIWKDLENI